MSKFAKMFVIGRADLSPGLRAAQVCHALTEFWWTRPDEVGKWYAESNNLVLLEVPDEAELKQLLAQLVGKGIAVAAFREPDRDDELTAIAVGPEGVRALSSLPLAFAARE